MHIFCYFNKYNINNYEGGMKEYRVKERKNYFFKRMFKEGVF